MSDPLPLSPRFGLGALFSMFGLAMGLMGGALAPLARQAGVETSALGLAMTAFMIAYIVAMTVGGLIMSRMPSRQVLGGAVVAMAGLLVLLEQAASVPAFFVAFSAYAFFGGMVDLVMNAELAALERRLGRPIMAFTHGMSSLGFGLGTAAGSLIAAEAGLGAVALVGVAALGFGLAAVLASVAHRPVLALARQSHGYPFSPALIIIGAVVGMDAAGEMMAGLWSGRAIEEISVELAAYAGTAGTCYAVAQALMRVCGDLFRRILGDPLVVLLSLVVAVAGFVMVGLMPGLVAKLAGFTLIGLGTGLVVPCGFAMGVATRPDMAAAALSTLSLVAGIPRIIVPTLFGRVAETQTVAGAFLMLGIALAVTVVLMAAVRIVQSR